MNTFVKYTFKHLIWCLSCLSFCFYCWLVSPFRPSVFRVVFFYIPTYTGYYSLPCHNFKANIQEEKTMKMTWETLLWYLCCQIWKGLVPNSCMHLAYILHLCAVLKKVYTKCKLEKYPRKFHHQVIDLKTELLVKIANDFEL